MQPVVTMYSKSTIVNELPFEPNMRLENIQFGRLGETKVFTTSSHGGVEGFPKILICLILGQIQLCKVVSMHRVRFLAIDLRLKQV